MSPAIEFPYSINLPTYTSTFYRGTIWHKYFTPYTKYKIFLLDGTPCGGEMWSRLLYLPGSRCLQNKLHSISIPWLDDAFKSVGMAVWYAEAKLWEGAGTRDTSILRDKTRGEFRITYCSIAGDLKTSRDWCYCEPYVHISKRPAGT